MWPPDGVVVEWPRAIKTIWARRLAPLGAREQGDRDLPEAWAEAIATAWNQGWSLNAVVPLKGDPHGHRWAVVLGRSDEHPAPNLLFVHGSTVSGALRRTTQELRAGVQAPA